MWFCYYQYFISKFWKCYQIFYLIWLSWSCCEWRISILTYQCRNWDTVNYILNVAHQLQVKDDQASLPCLELQSETLGSQDSVAQMSTPPSPISISNHRSCFSAPPPNSWLRAQNKTEDSYVNIINHSSRSGSHTQEFVDHLYLISRYCLEISYREEKTLLTLTDSYLFLSSLQLIEFISVI